jgi:hypothetical protein
VHEEGGGHPAGAAREPAGRRRDSRPASAKEAGTESTAAEERGVARVSACGREEGVARELAGGEEVGSWRGLPRPGKKPKSGCAVWSVGEYCPRGMRLIGLLFLTWIGPYKYTHRHMYRILFYHQLQNSLTLYIYIYIYI